jgi:hypothetical protein
VFIFISVFMRAPGAYKFVCRDPVVDVAQALCGEHQRLYGWPILRPGINIDQEETTVILMG